MHTNLVNSASKTAYNTSVVLFSSDNIGRGGYGPCRQQLRQLPFYESHGRETAWCSDYWNRQLLRSPDGPHALQHRLGLCSDQRLAGSAQLIPRAVIDRSHHKLPEAGIRSICLSVRLRALMRSSNQKVRWDHVEGEPKAMQGLQMNALVHAVPAESLVVRYIALRRHDHIRLVVLGVGHGIRRRQARRLLAARLPPARDTCTAHKGQSL